MRAALIGYGTMGRLVYEELGSECAVVIAPNGPDCMNNLFEYEKPIDIIIDFSVPANLNMICEYANKRIEGELFACDMPSFFVTARPGMVKVTYKAPIRLPLFALMRLWGTPTEITGQVQVYESKQEEFIRLVRGIKKDKETASDSEEISAED